MPTTANIDMPYPDESSDASLNVHIAALAGAIDSRIGPYVLDTGWLPLTLSLPSGWTTPSTPRVRKIGMNVYFSGSLQNNSFSGGFTTVARLPTGFPPPTSTSVSPLGSNSTAIRSAAATPQGLIQMYSGSASSAFFFLSALQYVSN